MGRLDTLHHWHQTNLGRATFGVVEVAGAYVCISFAFNSGSLWEYALTLVLLVGGLGNITQLIKQYMHHGHKQAKKA